MMRARNFASASFSMRDARQPRVVRHDATPPRGAPLSIYCRHADDYFKKLLMPLGQPIFIEGAKRAREHSILLS